MNQSHIERTQLTLPDMATWSRLLIHVDSVITSPFVAPDWIQDTGPTIITFIRGIHYSRHSYYSIPYQTLKIGGSVGCPYPIPPNHYSASCFRASVCSICRLWSLNRLFCLHNIDGKRCEICWLSANQIHCGVSRFPNHHDYRTLPISLPFAGNSF